MRHDAEIVRRSDADSRIAMIDAERGVRGIRVIRCQTREIRLGLGRRFLYSRQEQK